MPSTQDISERILTGENVMRLTDDRCQRVVMPNVPKDMAKRKHHVSGSDSGQSRTARFFMEFGRGIRDVGKIAIRDPFLVALAVLFLVASKSTTTYSQQNAPNTNKPNTEQVQTNSNTFTVEFDGKNVNFKNFITADRTKVVEFSVPISTYLRAITGKDSIAPNEATVERIGDGAFVFLKNGVIGVYPDDALNASRIPNFSYQGEIRTYENSKNSAVVILTTSELDVINPSVNTTSSLSTLFKGKVPNNLNIVQDPDNPDCALLMEGNNPRFRIHTEAKDPNRTIENYEPVPALVRNVEANVGATQMYVTNVQATQMNVTYENGIKIVGEKTFDIGIKDGLLYSKDGTSTYSEEGKRTETSWLKELTGSETPSNKDIKQIIYVNDQVKGKVAYLVLKHGIVFVAPENHNKEQVGFAGSKDGSEVFTHEGAIFTAPNGSVVAATPLDLIVITPKEGAVFIYQEIFGNIPPLKRPTISGSSDANIVFIRDETMKDGINAARLELDLTTLNVRVGEDSNKNEAKVELKDGVLTITNVIISNSGKYAPAGEYATITFDIKGINRDVKEKGETFQFPENIKPTVVFGAQLDGVGIGAFLIYGDSKIVAIFKGEKGVKAIYNPALDNSSIFTHEGAIFIAQNGSIVGTTPTTLLVITPNDVLSVTYDELFGKTLPFKKPTISGSSDLKLVFIRDPTMSNNTDAVRLELDLETLKVRVSDDDTVHTK